MSPRTVAILAVLTLLASLGAVAAVLMEPESGRIEITGEPAFPTLRDDPDAVARIEVLEGGEEVVVERTEGGGWVSQTHDGYPVEPGLARDLVVALSDMQLVEAKTSDPARFARLEVEDPELEGARSRRLTLRDRDGEVVAEAIVGKERNRLTGTEPAGTYLRRPGEDQSWLASGRLALPEEAEVWLQRLVVDLPAEAVVEVETTPGDGAAYTLRRSEDERWTLVAADGERALADDADPGALAGALAGLRHQGIAREDEVAWPDPAHRLRYTSDQGLILSLRAAEVDGEPWMAIEAAPTGDEDAAVTARADAIAARTGGWAYRLPRSAFERLIVPLDSLVDDGTS